MNSLNRTGPLLASMEPWLAALLLALAQGIAIGVLQALNLWLGAVPIDAPAWAVGLLTTIARIGEGLIAQLKVARA